MDNSILVSFIIPAYNAASTLAACVDSITCRKSNDYEIIIVENGSSDSTYQLALFLTKEYPQIKVFQSKKGVSNARNLGIEEAVGKWIFFVDADDKLISEKINSVFDDAVKSSSDLIIYSHIAGSESRPVTDAARSFKNAEVENARIIMLESPTRYMTVWAKLFRRDIANNYNIRFNSELSFSEDSHFIFNYTKHCAEITFSEEAVYNYVLSECSAVRTLNSGKIDSYLLALNETAKLTYGESGAVKAAFNCFVLMHLNLIGVHEVFAVNSKGSFAEKTRTFKTLCLNPVFNTPLNELKITDCNRLAMLPPLFAKMRLYALSGIVLALRSFQNKRKEDHN